MKSHAPATGIAGAAVPEQSNPVILQSSSLFFRDDAANSSKEFHAQLVEVGTNEFNVSCQHGKRGSNLVTGDRFGFPVSRLEAWSDYHELVSSKKIEGYKSIHMGKLNEIYKKMTQLGFDNAGLDLFISARGKVIGLADYSRINEALNQDGKFAFVDSYRASRAIGTMLSGLGGAGLDAVNEKQIEWDADTIADYLRNSGLIKAGIFLGRQVGETIKPYFPADELLMMVVKKAKHKP